MRAKSHLNVNCRSCCPVPLSGKTVISTEAAHSFTVSSAAEKSASLPIPFPSLIAPLPLQFAVAFALALAVAFAVILSVAKDPEALDEPPPSGPSQPESRQSLPSSTRPKSRQRRWRNPLLYLPTVTTISTPGRPRRSVYPTGPTKINFENVACFSRLICVASSTTLSPRIHHHLPRKKPRSAHPNSQKPLQNREITAQKKNSTRQ